MVATNPNWRQEMTMSDPPLQNRGHLLKHARRSTGPGITALVGCFGYIIWETTVVGRRNLRRVTEINQELNRRLEVFHQESQEVLKEMAVTNSDLKDMYERKDRS